MRNFINNQAHERGCEANELRIEKKVLTVPAGTAASLFPAAEYPEGSAPLDDCNAMPPRAPKIN